MSSYQLALVESSIQRELGTFFCQHINYYFPEAIISITKVALSKDLRHAKVFISIYKAKSEKEEQIMQKIKNSSKAIGHQLNKRIKMRYVPKIVWINDKLIDNANKLIKTIENLD